MPRHALRSLPFSLRTRVEGPARLRRFPYAPPREFEDNDGGALAPRTYLPLTASAWRTETASRTGAAVPAIGASVAGLTSDEAGGYPADVQLAVGPSAAIESVNEALAIFARRGGTLQRTSVETLGSFFSTSAADRRLDNVGDSRVVYDASSGRWFALAFDETRHQTVVAVSSSSDPNASWSVWTFDSERCPDQPRLAVGTSLLIFSVDSFSDCAGGRFVQSELTLVNKTALIAGSIGSQDYGAFSSPYYHAATPTQSVSPLAAPYLVSVDSRSSMTAHVAAPVSPTQASIPVRDVPLSATLSSPPAAPEPGGTLDAGDNRVQTAFWDNGTLWFTAGESCVAAGESSPRGCARLTGISTTSYTVVESRDLVLDQQRHILYPAMSSDASGNLEVVFGYSAAGEPAGIGTVTKLGGGGFTSWRTVSQGTSGYVLTDPGGRNRWGDYFAAVRDPSDPAAVWVAAEYASGSRSWATTIASLYAPTSSAPVVSYSTPSALGVTENAAVLTANLNPQGAPAAYHFEYGTTTAYGVSTQPAQLAATTIFQQVSASVSGLLPGTTYHFRLVASNGVVTTSGIDQTFATATPPPPPPPTTTTPTTTPPSTARPPTKRHPAKPKRKRPR